MADLRYVGTNCPVFDILLSIKWRGFHPGPKGRGFTATSGKQPIGEENPADTVSCPCGKYVWKA